jgi:hypothetical protein
METKYRYIHSQPQNGPEFDEEMDLEAYFYGAFEDHFAGHHGTPREAVELLVESLKFRFPEKVEEFMWLISKAITCHWHDTGSADWLTRRRR